MLSKGFAPQWQCNVIFTKGVSPDSGCPSTVRQHGPRMLGPLAGPLAPCLLVLAGGQGLAPPLAAAAQGPGVPAAGAGSPALLASAPATTRTCKHGGL